MHTTLGSVQDKVPGIYIGMPGNAARAYGIADENVGPFGKPWACLKDPRGWQIAYSEYLYTRMKTDGDFALDVRDLHGQHLLCWCLAKAKRRPDFDMAKFACHGLILIHAVEWIYHEMTDGGEVGG